jgi:hypothetical protein
MIDCWWPKTEAILYLDIYNPESRSADPWVSLSGTLGIPYTQSCCAGSRKIFPSVCAMSGTRLVFLQHRRRSIASRDSKVDDRESEPQIGRKETKAGWNRTYLCQSNKIRLPYSFFQILSLSQVTQTSS